MRFLCLHGRGTNSKIFEMQTAAIRYELGDSHTYDFVEGSIPAEIDPSLKAMVTGDGKAFSYFIENDVKTAQRALLDLDAYVDAEGPFDGIIAFSQAVGLAGTWLVHRRRASSPSSVRCAIFLAGGSSALDPTLLLEEGAIVHLPAAKVGEIINIPTAHVYGVADPYAPEAVAFSALCGREVRSVYVHPGVHEVPGSGAGSSGREVLNLTVNTIRRAIGVSA